MKTLNVFSRLLGVLALVLASSAWAISETDVLNAIKNNDPDSAEKIALLAAEQNMSVADVVAALVARDPYAAPKITAAAVAAAPASAGDIARAAAVAIANSSVPESERQMLQADVVAAAVSVAPPNQQAAIRRAMRGILPTPVVDAAFAAGQDSSYRAGDSYYSRGSIGNSGSGTGSGSGSGSGGGGGGGTS